MAMPITQRLDEIEIGLASQRSRIETLEQVIQGLCGYIGVSPEQFLRPPPPEPDYNRKLQADLAGGYAISGSVMAEHSR